jgi:hypothetical protein
MIGHPMEGRNSLECAKIYDRKCNELAHLKRRYEELEQALIAKCAPFVPNPPIVPEKK